MLCLCAAQLKSWFQTYLGRETLASYYRQGRQLLLTFLTLVTRWSRPTSNFYALIGQNLTGVHAGNLCNSLETCFTLTAEAGRFFCQPMYKKWNSAAIKSLLLFVASLFIGFLVKKYVVCQSWKSDFGWHRFRFSPCLTRKRVEKSETILALLDSFKELHLEWLAWVIIVFDVFFLYI